MLDRQGTQSIVEIFKVSIRARKDEPTIQANCAISERRNVCEVSYGFSARLRDAFGQHFRTMDYDDYYKEEEIWVLVTCSGVTIPVTYSTNSQFTSDCDEEYQKLGRKLPEGVDITISNSIYNEFRWKILENNIFGKEMNCHPIFHRRFNKSDKNYKSCFVAMPFNEDWSSRIYSRHLTKTIEKSGFKCARADEMFGPVSIIEDIWEQICNSGVIVADLTGRNPNVFYELGIAHTVGTPVILISQDHEIPAFDTAHIRQIVYQDNSDGCEKLENDLAKALDYVRQKMDFPSNEHV